MNCPNPIHDPSTHETGEEHSHCPDCNGTGEVEDFESQIAELKRQLAEVEREEEEKNHRLCVMSSDLEVQIAAVKHWREHAEQAVEALIELQNKTKG